MKTLLLVTLAAIAAAQPNTAKLTKEVRHELVMLPYYGVFDNLAYRVDGAKVTLFGQVVKPTLKSDAENVVKKIEGVERVDNEIEVLPLSPQRRPDSPRSLSPNLFQGSFATLPDGRRTADSHHCQKRQRHFDGCRR